jgi:hypothetical protein
MASSMLNLPIDIPWKLIAASSDMMDTKFCSKAFPFQWRSSLAISAYEPKPEDLSDELCDQQITYFKVTATITGYQPTATETQEVQTAAGYLPIDLPGADEAFDQILSEYWACYGALLNVAVFPATDPKLNGTLIAVTFAPPTDPEGQKVSNPYQREGVIFEAQQVANNVVVPHHDLTNGWGPVDPSRGDLTLPGPDAGFHRMRITLPAPSSHVEAKIVIAIAEHGAAEPDAVLLRMTAYDANGEVAQDSAHGEGLQSLVVAADGIVQLELADGDIAVEAFLVELDYSRKVTLSDYPHIVDFEPKTRDLYQAATETGEILTASNSELQTGKSYTHSQSSELGLALSSKSKSGSNGVGSESSSAFTGKWGNTDQDTQSVAIDSSRDRRERYATTTEVTQLYNVLTGYHVGTNRALFLMLARPHTLQPTDHRTFVQGLRMIEGVQEFLLIVSRPRERAGVCIETSLETGHFPEHVDVQPTPAPTMTADFAVEVHASNGAFSGETKNIESEPQSVFTVPTGWFIDYTKGDLPDHPGVSQTAVRGNHQANNSLRQYNYRATDDTHVQVFGQIQGAGGYGDGAIFDRSYRAYLTKPPPTSDTPAVTSHFLITSRELCACLRGGTTCLQPPPPAPADQGAPSIVHERTIQLEGLSSGDGNTWLPAVKTLQRKLGFTMSTSWRQPSRLPLGQVGFLDSDYLKNRIQQLLPQDALARPIGDVAGLPPAVVEALGADTSVADALNLDLPTFARRTGLSLPDSGLARRRLLGIEPDAGGPIAVQPEE